ncbi:MAG: FAD-dependent oxidoreductase [Candidatus Cloacimonas sp.]|jgi:NADPH-dependent 2,4-dienoyl-CoA reductase/sulfur reductase-like enzyme|nr:FAD-dependent oxidoreductase [Candidatus Cloacimonas sp.]
MKSYDVIIVGGGPSAIITGLTGKKQNPDKSFLMIKEEEKGLVPCGIPYIFHDLGDVSKNLMGPAPFVAAGGEVITDTVIDVNLLDKTLKTKAGAEFSYDKLVFATGSVPIVPSFIKGYDLQGVEYIKKSFEYIKALKEKTDKAKDIVIIGGGFIGVEVAEQLAKYTDKTISLVEMQEYCLINAFSQKITTAADKVIREQGIKLYTSTKVTEIVGKDGTVTGVKLSTGAELKADMVILAIGYLPNTELAAKTGLEIKKNRAIVRDNYMRTTAKDVFAVGDCSASTGFITGRMDNVMLASTATAEARIVGYNLFKIGLIRNFPGTLSVFSTEIGGRVFASAGAIEQTAVEMDIDYINGEFEDVDRHPESIADASKLWISLIVSPKTGVIIGGEICGGKSAGEIINIISLAIQKGVTVYELVSYQIGTHPLLTPAPTKYVLIKAAEVAMAKIKLSQNCPRQ